VRITFLGTARTVTGSRRLIGASGARILPLLLLAPCLGAALPAMASTTAGAGDRLDSLLAVQRVRAGERAGALFAPIDQPETRNIAPEEVGDYRFLLANLPLSDLAALEARDLLENVRLARRARAELPWGATVPEELWRHYVLPCRISQEPFTRWRLRFLRELEPRVRSLPMAQAALEVNHWCHEQATYQPSDGRDQDPLTTCRAGLGRCEEEMVLAIAALRSVGIPARQCYTPYWAHTDDNHAWVEIWSEGAWSFLGACEPAPALGQAWFTDPARRAMLVVSQAFGAVPEGGTEPVLRREGRSTSVNSTAVYGPVKTLSVTVTDGRGRPLKNQRVLFNLFNYGGWMPALAQVTDEQGRVELACGLGTWLATAGDGRRAGLLEIAPDRTEAVLRLERPDRLSWPRAAEYAPPSRTDAPEQDAGLFFAEGLARGLVDTAAIRRADQAFQRRLQREDSLREGLVWGRWLPADEVPPGLAQRMTDLESSLSLAPDSLRLAPFLRGLRARDASARALGFYRRARGNWGELHRFLCGRAPVWVSEMELRWSRAAPDQDSLALERRLSLLEACSDKDLREIGGETLRDHEEALRAVGWPLEGDSLAWIRTRECVLPPRLDDEPCLPWRGELRRFLAAHPELAASRDDRALRRWLRRGLRLDQERDRLGAPLSPAQTLALGGGSRGDLERLYLGLCRARGLAARREPLSGRLERWEDGAWRAVRLFRDRGGAPSAPTGRLSITAADSLAGAALCLKDWCLARWEGDHLEALDLGWQQPLSALSFPLELPAGRYCLSAGRRREDGSAAVRMTWLTVEKGRETGVALELEPVEPTP
jgi:transglutaminase-like putative cysteine protease